MLARLESGLAGERLPDEDQHGEPTQHGKDQESLRLEVDRALELRRCSPGTGRT